MASSELGAKQICPACSTKFYDLNRRPAHCPKCATEFDPEEAMRNRRVRARAVLPEDDQVEEKPPVVEEAVLTGSVSRGVADELSDIEMLLVTLSKVDVGRCFEQDARHRREKARI